MSPVAKIVCDVDSLATDCKRIAASLELAIDVVVDALARSRAGRLYKADSAIALALSRAPEASMLAEWSGDLVTADFKPAIAFAWADEGLVEFCRDLGFIAVRDLHALCAVIAFQSAKTPWIANLEALPELDRVRLHDVMQSNFDSAPIVFERRADGLLQWRDAHNAPRAIGTADAGREALSALRSASTVVRPSAPRVQGVEAQTVLDIIFGPPRALSDPSSKSALGAYDIPLPAEELCASPSRAASEATRIGFPVRIALASPDLRIWDHPELVADGVDNAARVRDVFREITALATTRAPEARLLGVTVSASIPAQALLRLDIRPVGGELLLAEVSFSDPHGIASHDKVATILPATAERIRYVLRRLRGSALFEAAGARPNETLDAISDVLLRLTAFGCAWKKEIASIRVDPLAILPHGSVEVREACVTVGEAFVKSLT